MPKSRILFFCLSPGLLLHQSSYLLFRELVSRLFPKPLLFDDSIDHLLLHRVLLTLLHFSILLLSLLCHFLVLYLFPLSVSPKHAIDNIRVQLLIICLFLIRIQVIIPVENPLSRCYPFILILREVLISLLHSLVVIHPHLGDQVLQVRLSGQRLKHQIIRTILLQQVSISFRITVILFTITSCRAFLLSRLCSTVSQSSLLSISLSCFYWSSQILGTSQLIFSMIIPLFTGWRFMLFFQRLARSSCKTLSFFWRFTRLSSSGKVLDSFLICWYFVYSTCIMIDLSMSFSLSCSITVSCTATQSLFQSLLCGRGRCPSLYCAKTDKYPSSSLNFFFSLAQIFLFFLSSNSSSLGFSFSNSSSDSEYRWMITHIEPWFRHHPELMQQSLHPVGGHGATGYPMLDPVEIKDDPSLHIMPHDQVPVAQMLVEPPLDVLPVRGHNDPPERVVATPMVLQTN